MSAEPDREPSIVREVPLDRLAPPEHDVRDDRDPDDVRGLAQSMSENGQISPLTTYCGELPEGNGEFDREDFSLDELADRCEAIHIVDGLSRLAAAETMGWPTLRCEVFREAPEHISILSLAANTDRLPMSDYETVRALHDYKEETGEPLRVIGERAGYAPSTLSNYFGALDSPEFLIDAWRSKENDVGLGHVVEIASLPTEETQRKVLRDAVQYSRPVSHTREVARNAVNEAQREADDDQTIHDKQMEGQSEAAQREIQRAQKQMEEKSPCDICGDPHETQVVLDVCPSDYGMIKTLQQSGAPLLEAVRQSNPSPEDVEAAQGEP